MPSRQLSREKKFYMQKPTSIRSIRQGGMGGDRAGRQGWPPGKGGSKGVGLREPGRGSRAGPGEGGRPGEKTRRRRGGKGVIITAI